MKLVARHFRREAHAKNPPNVHLQRIGRCILIAFVAVLFRLGRSPPTGPVDLSEKYSVEMDLIVEESSRVAHLALPSFFRVQDLFLQLRKDEETQQFVDTSLAQSSTIRQRMSNILYTLVKGSIGQYFYRANDELTGALFPGSLFVASEEQFGKFLEPMFENGETGDFHLLDIGAGDGTVTAKIAKIADIKPRSVLAIEASMFKRWRLQSAGFNVSIDLPSTSEAFDLLVMLNVLDCTHDPAQLLSDAIALLKPGGFFILGFVVPYQPRVKFGVKTLAGLTQTFKKGQRHTTFEVNFVELLQVLSDYRLTLRKWTRLPYLSSGDQRFALYSLDDALILLQKA